MLRAAQHDKHCMSPLFLFLSFVALLSALGVVLAKNPIHSVLFLILTFFTLSGHYLLLNAQFLAAVNIIVYAGAIMVLFLFVVMLLNAPQEETEQDVRLHHLMRRGPMKFGAFLAIVLAVAFVGVLVYFTSP